MTIKSAAFGFFTLFLYIIILSEFNVDEVITSEIVQKLADLPPFPNLRKVYLQNVQPFIDLKAFGEFVKKNPTIVSCYLRDCWENCCEEFHHRVKRIGKLKALEKI
uniref:Uncharacterized protein n=1 Tax=Panagrolaimus davidi TaxID=227884 RepID=A0A914Q660_9BILA